MSWVRCGSKSSLAALLVGAGLSLTAQAGYWDDYYHATEVGKAALNAEMRALLARNVGFDYSVVKIAAEVRLHLEGLSKDAGILAEIASVQKESQPKATGDGGIFEFEDDSSVASSSGPQEASDDEKPEVLVDQKLPLEDKHKLALLDAKSRCKRIKKLLLSVDTPSFWNWGLFKVGKYDETLNKIADAVPPVESGLFVTASGFLHLRKQIQQTLSARDVIDLVQPQARPVSPACRTTAGSYDGRPSNFSDPSANKIASSAPVDIKKKKSRQKLTRSQPGSDLPNSEASNRAALF